MSRNQVIMEYDEKKFEEDIEKAKALSLETMALDQYRRNKLQYASVNDVTDASQSQFKLSTSQNNLTSAHSIMSSRSTTRPRPGSLGNASSTTAYSFGNSFPTSSTISLSPPPPPEAYTLEHQTTRLAVVAVKLDVNNRKANVTSSAPQPPPPSSSSSLAPPPQAIQRNNNRNITTNPTKPTNETNLMSFDDSLLLATDSVSLTSPANDPHTEFMQKIDKMHRQNAQFSEAVVPVMPAPVFQHPATILATANAPTASMALMPYHGLNSNQTTKKPLTPDELSKLYNMGPFGQPMYQPPQYLSGGTIIAQSQYMQQTAQQTTMYSYPYSHTFERPINKPIPYSPQQQQQQQQQQHLQHAAATINTLTVQQHSTTANFSNSNSCTNIENNLALLPHNQITNSIDTKTIPFITEPNNKSKKSINNHCDNTERGNSNNGASIIAIPRRTLNATPQNGDLIDLNQRIENSSRVSVLEAFDPLLLNDSSDASDQGDVASECGTSYYSEYDPFDYLYSCGTQYSDPVYEAAHKFDRAPMSPANNDMYASSQEHFPKLSSDWGDVNEWIDHDDDFVKIDDMTAPPLPPRNNAQQNNSIGTVLPPIDRSNKIDRFKVATKLDENIIVNKTYDAELVAFFNMVKNVRSKFHFNDESTNVGHIVAAEYDNYYPEGTEIKLLVHPYLNPTKNSMNRNSASDSGIETSMSDLTIETNGSNNQKGSIEGYGPPVAFTCDICTTVEHVIMHVFCELEGQLCSGSVEDYILKPIAVNEWLRPTSKLSQLDCVHQSLKLEQDVQFGLWSKSQADLKSLARTQQDDVRDADIRLEDILTHEPVETIKYGDLKILLQTLEAEIAKIELAAVDSRPHAVVSHSGVVQAVKMICKLLGSIDTLNITSAIGELNRVAASGQPTYNYLERGGGGVLEVDSEIGDYARVKLRPKTFHEQIKYCCNRIREAVQSLLDIFSHAFRVDFCVETAIYRTNPIPITNIKDEVMVQVMCLHRVPPLWKHDYYILVAQLSHGTCYISDPIVTQCSNDKSGLFAQNLKFDTCLRFDRIPLSTLPRESRLTFVLYGCTTEPAEGTNANTSSDTGDNAQNKVAKIELGWSSIQFFDFERQMIEGSYLLPQWPPTADRFLGPAPAKGTHPRGGECPTLSINVPSHGGRIVFPEVPQNSTADRLDLNSLDKNLQQELIDMAEQGYPMALAKREVFWEKRFYLHKLPHALPKILHAAHSWDFDSVRDLHAMVRLWELLSPLQAFELLLPRYPDMVVRAQAVKWISAMSNDELADYLPQLLQALKHDTYEASELAEFLLTRSLESPRIAHHLYWLLVHSLPGDSPQNTIDQTQTDFEESILTMARYDRRNLMMLRSLLAICGKNLSDRFLGQNMMCSTLARIASNVKQAKESVRQKVLVHGMEEVHQNLLRQPTALPLSPSFEVTAVNVRSCGYFNSNTLPLKVSFVGPDRMILPAIFKAGDDLQQDMLTIQLVRVMDRLWLQEGLDLKMVTFNCIPTGHKRGMIEMVTDAETLRKIQVEWGLTGSFKDKPIAEWLERQNPSQLEYQRAVDNFTVSCAGYSVVTYILGICDRHNDNIMLKTSGHLFHIDFGKFLGDAQMFGNFKRDRTPFVLTSDMAYVINMGDRPSIKFQHFVDLCCKAFNIVRKHGDLILHMLALMATSGIPGVTADAVNYVRTALLPGQSNPEAAASFAKLIHISLKSWFTQFNFFLHNLAQMRFTADDCNGELLTFVPRTYTMAQDGRLESVTVYGYQKRYDLEKYYTYILKVTRQNQPDPAYLFRSYKEFSELHQKLCIHFPLSKLHSLPSGIHVGRSNIKTVAERRLPEIRLFLISLFNSADEIAHSDLVYTFFHPLLRDQQEQDISVAKVKDTHPTANTRDNVRGEIKLSVQYHRGALTVMIYHARSLPPSTGGQVPNTYVKTYLIPDPTKSTKRKTKVVRKNCFPTFMETLEYRMPLESIQNRVLQVTVWSHDSLQENEFLGGVDIHLGDLDLKEEFSKWFPLGYVTRT